MIHITFTFVKWMNLVIFNNTAGFLIDIFAAVL